MATRMLCLVAAAFAVGANAAIVPRATDNSGLLSVTGQGSVEIPTTETQVSASVQKTTSCPDPKNCSGQKAQQEAAAATKSVLDYLKGTDGVTDIVTNNVVLQPQYDYSQDNSPAKLTGYTATSSISFQVPNDQAGEVLDEIVKEGATSIDSVSFTATDEAVADATDEALTKAVKDAQKQADAVLKAIGATQEGIVSIEVGSASAPPSPAPAPVMASMANDGASAKMPIEGGAQTVTASVTLHIKYN